MSEHLRETSYDYEQARCALPGCGEFLHMVVISDQPVYLSFAAGDLRRTEGWDGTWEVRCEAGHVVLLPPGNGRESPRFGECLCEPGEEQAPDDYCGHGDLARLRAVTLESRGS